MANEDVEKSPYTIFYDNAPRGIAFQLLIAITISLIFLHNKVPLFSCFVWLGIIMAFNAIRIFFLITFYKKKRYQTHPRLTILIFSLIMLILGITWGSAYLFLWPDAQGMREGLVILTLGGMSIGAIPSLAPYLIVYLAYVLPMLTPVVFMYYMKFDFDYTLFSTMIVAFIAMVVMTAVHFQKLVLRTISLDQNQRNLLNQLSRSNKELISAYNEIKKLSRTDSLTDLPNRRFFDETLNREWARAMREKAELSLLLIDVDNFKVINDDLGHPEGDKYLRDISLIMKMAIKRPSDFLSRIGGDEFAVILTNTPLNNAHVVAENMRNSICEYNQKIYPEKNLSISIGLSSNLKQVNVQALINGADKCLYEAKSKGKNRVFSDP